MDGMTWEQRFWVAWQALVEMEMRADNAEALVGKMQMDALKESMSAWQRVEDRKRRSTDVS